jgi:cysteine synthase A
MSVERRQAIVSYGANLILTDGTKGMNGAVEKVKEMQKKEENIFVPDQFNNIDNMLAHYNNTSLEILSQLNVVDVFVSGIGTSGTISGIGKRFKGYDKSIRIIGIEPQKSAVISGFEHCPHMIQGIGAGFIPGLYNDEFVDYIIVYEDNKLFELQKLILKKTGLFLGLTSIANVGVAIQVSKEYDNNKRIVTVAPDNGDKYISLAG